LGVPEIHSATRTGKAVRQTAMIHTLQKPGVSVNMMISLFYASHKDVGADCVDCHEFSR
jgi:hypothetical protein